MTFGLQSALANFQRAHGWYSPSSLSVCISLSGWHCHLQPRLGAQSYQISGCDGRLLEKGVHVNSEKIAIKMEKFKYIVGSGMVKSQINKEEAIQAFPHSVTKKQVCAFLGLVGYYWRFVPTFFTIASPLTDNETEKVSHGLVEWHSWVSFSGA